MNLNKILSTITRWLSVKFLVIIFVIAFGYGFLVAFFAINSTWAIPIRLSPSQDRVLGLQPQIIALESNYRQQLIELQTASATVTALTEQTTELDALVLRIQSAQKAESRDQSRISNELQGLAAARNRNLADTRSSVSSLRALMKKTEEELAAQLITIDQATERRISLQAQINAATGLQVSATQLQQEATQSRRNASTLAGGSSSLASMSSASQLAQLTTLQTQIEIQLITAMATKGALTTSIREMERVLATAKQSPYYEALRTTINVAFIPYANQKGVTNGAAVYDCILQVIFCSKVGQITQIYSAEEYAKHPLFKTDQKGSLVKIELSNQEAARSSLFFFGGKPLFL